MPYAKTGDGLSEPGRGAGDNASPSDFDKSGNPIKFRGANYDHHITTGPPPLGISDLPTAWGRRKTWTKYQMVTLYLL